jgi:hypothetical protein
MMFIGPVTLISNPNNPLDWNRYLYARANPLKYTDPSGHAGVVNAVHESIIPPSSAGKSYQDLTLGYEGTSLGAKLNAGSIDLASEAPYVNNVLSPGSPNAAYWAYMYTAAWNAMNQYLASPY